jgi:hypothetical protein
VAAAGPPPTSSSSVPRVQQASISDLGSPTLMQLLDRNLLDLLGGGGCSSANSPCSAGVFLRTPHA